MGQSFDWFGKKAARWTTTFREFARAASPVEIGQTVKYLDQAYTVVGIIEFIGTSGELMPKVTLRAIHDPTIEVSVLGSGGVERIKPVEM